MNANTPTMGLMMQAFDFNDAAVRVTMRDDEPWFVAKDVCDVLAHSNSRMAIADLDEDEKGVSITDTLGGPQKINLISESGLYALIFKSRKPEAKKFRKWVTSVVIPAIRKTGGYALPMARAQLDEVRELLITSARGVRDKTLDVGRAQQVANLAARFLEALKLEGDAVGYETMLGLPGGEGSGGLLRKQNAGAELLQGVPQPSMPSAAAGESRVSAEAIPGEEALGKTERAAGADASAQASWEADLP